VPRLRARVAALAILLSAAACSRQTESPATAPAPPAAESREDPAATSGRVAGAVGGFARSASIVVVLEPQTARTFAPQDEKPVMDQVGQAFGPDLLIVRTGQPVEFRNNDDTLHNVHVNHDETREPAFNVAIPTGGAYTYSFPRDGFYHVACDIHPSMSASIFATTTPFATLADAEGRFAFEDVPMGAWHLHVYALGRHLQRDVEVRGGVNEVRLESGVE